MFSGCTFALCIKDNKIKIKKQIESENGLVVSIVDSKTTFVLATLEALKNKSTMVVSAKKLNIPILQTTYIEACISSSKKLDHQPYLCVLSTSENNPTVDQQNNTTNVIISSGISMGNSLKEVRVFISSTITDMLKERECLLKKVFPELRAMCTERGVFFTWVDLRWGITDEQRNAGQVLKLCLNEVEHSNYFVCILGERYGWSQSANNDPILSKTLNTAAQSFPWVKNCMDKSITELEIRQAMEASQNKNRRALFLFRDPNSNWISTATQDEKQVYQSDGEVQLRKLNELKNFIRAKKYPLIDNYQSIQQFGQMVLENLRSAINQDCPLEKSVNQNFKELERNHQLTYINYRTQAYVDRASISQQITNFAFSNDAITTPLVLLGQEGCGKTSILANWYLAHKDDKTAFILPFFVSAGNYHINHLLKWILTELKQKFEIILPIPDDEYLIRDFSYWLQIISEKGQVVLILDEVDKLDISVESKDKGASSVPLSYLAWLPVQFPLNFKVILSTSIEEFTTASSKNRKFHLRIDVPPFNETEKQSFVKQYLSLYGKSASDDQMNLLKKSSRTDSPVYLRAVVDQIQHCKFETINQTLHDNLNAKDITALYLLIFSQWEKDFNTKTYPNMVQNALTYLTLARRGLSESDLYSILDIQPALAFDWEIFYSSVLRTNVINRNGNLQLFHNYLRRAVRMKYLTNQKLIIGHHEKLANHFSKIPINRTKLEEYPYHLEITNKKQELKEFMSSFDTFYYMYTGGEALKQDLYHYWYHILRISNEQIGDIYFPLATQFASENPPGDILGDRLRSLSDFFSKIGQYSKAISLLRTVLYTDENLYGQWHELVATDLYLISFNFYEMADYEEAATKAQRAYAMTRSALGNDHFLTAERATLIGLIFKKQGHYSDALPFYEEALTIIEKNYGENHTSMGEYLSYIGDLHRKSGNFEPAVQYYTRALKIVGSSKGDLSLEYGQIKNQLGLVFKKRGEYTKAEENYAVALNIIEKSYGADHPKVSEILYNIADVNRKRGDYDRAMTLYQKSLVIVKKTFGADHPEVAEILNDIGLVKKKQGHYDEAINVYNEAFRIVSSKFGDIHHKCGLYLTNIADVYRKLAKYAQAEDAYKRATEILEKSLGENHFEVAEVLNARAMVLKKKTFYDEAEPLYTRALTIIENTFGTDHPKYGLYLNNLADLERKRGKYHEAYRIYARALRIIEDSLGEQHSEAADILNNMGLIKTALEYYHDALELFTRALKIVIKEFGQEHPKVGMYLNNMGDAFCQVKTLKPAEACFTQSLVILFKTLGKDHVEVADVLANYGSLLRTKKMHNWSKALGLYQNAIKIITSTFGKDHPKVIKWTKITKDLESKKVPNDETAINKLFSTIAQSSINLELIPGIIENKEKK